MRTKHALLLVVAVTAGFVLSACERLTTDEEAPAPVITGQGFDIDSTQEGTVGQFDSLRLRIESPGRVGKLEIKERSYHVDLASTPERAHFNLFGINRRPLNSRDVTLDFQNYVNHKLEQAGDYTILVEVTDKLAQVSKINILIRLAEPKDVPAPKPAESEPAQIDVPAKSSLEQSESEPVKIAQFEIQRIGPREVEGEQVFGLTWKTVDEIYVTIRVQKRDDGATKLTGLSVSDYENVATVNNLNQLLESAQDQDYVDFNTANNAGADKVLGVVNLGTHYLIKTNQSNTVLSAVGTTVTLKGEYKYQ